MIIKSGLYFLNRFVQTLTNKQDGVVNYGVSNSLPNDNLKTISASGTARRAVGVLSRYIRGNGFAKQGEVEVGVSYDANALLAVMSQQLGWFGGVSLLVRYTADKKPVVEPIAFQGVRRKIDGSFDYNPATGTKEYKKSDTVNYPKFESDFTKYKGFPRKGAILYAFEESVENPWYPVPEFNSGIEDIKTSAELSLLDLEMVMNGFLPSGILTTTEFDDKTEDERDKTEYDRFADMMRKFTGKEKDPKTGLSGRMSLLHIMVKTMDEAPTLTTYDTKTIADASISKRDAVNREVCRLFGVHPVLCGFSDAAILGNQQAVANAATELINYVKSSQEMIEALMKDLFIKSFDISPFTTKEVIPQQVWDKLTTNEIRELAGYPPIIETNVTDTEV